MGSFRLQHVLNLRFHRDRGAERAGGRWRLAIEALETRTLLAAAPLGQVPYDAAVESVPSVTIGLGMMAPNEIGGLDQGGIVSMRGLVDQLAESSPTILSANVGGISSPLIAGQYWDVGSGEFGVEFGFSDLDYTFAGDLDGNNLPPATITDSDSSVLSGDGEMSSTAISPASIEPARDSGARLQGGGVSLAAVSAALTSPHELDSPARALAIATLEAGEEPSSDPLLAARTMPEEAIAGEWARAIAFERARDTDAENVDLEGRAKLSRLLESARDREAAPRAGEEPAAKKAIVSEEQADGDKVSFSDLDDLFAVPLAEMASSVGAAWLAGPLATSAALVGGAVAGAAEASGLAAEDQSSPGAMAEAFAGWGREVSSEVPCSVSAREIWNWTPLLLVLALERISSGNSRRSKESGTPRAPRLKS